MLRKARSAVYQTVGQFIARLFVRTRPDQRRVLPACHNPMMASYLHEVHDLIKEDPRIVVRASVKIPEEAAGDTQLCMSLLDCRYLSARISKLQPWDLVVVANHPGFFRDGAAKSARKVLRIPHGIGSKRLNGVDYMYNKNCFDEEGELIYSRIFEVSFERRDLAVAQDPAFEGKISVIGSIKLDKIDALRKSRVKRSEEGRKRVLVVSSWGTGNLFEHLQTCRFSPAARELEGEFTFTLRPHPNLVSTVNPDMESFKQQLGEWALADNVEISPPGRTLESDLAECDLLLGDDLTSVSLFASALDLPMALWRTENPGVGEGTYLSRLSTSLPCLEPDEDLGSILRRCAREPHSPTRKQLAEGLRSFPHEAEQRARTEIYKLLELSEPSPGQA